MRRHHAAAQGVRAPVGGWGWGVVLTARRVACQGGVRVLGWCGPSSHLHSPSSVPPAPVDHPHPPRAPRRWYCPQVGFCGGQGFCGGLFCGPRPVGRHCVQCTERPRCRTAQRPDPPGPCFAPLLPHSARPLASAERAAPRCLLLGALAPSRVRCHLLRPCITCLTLSTTPEKPLTRMTHYALPPFRPVVG
jgi:hypothetical protein